MRGRKGSRTLPSSRLGKQARPVRNTMVRNHETLTTPAHPTEHVPASVPHDERVCLAVSVQRQHGTNVQPFHNAALHSSERAERWCAGASSGSVAACLPLSACRVQLLRGRVRWRPRPRPPVVGIRCRVATARSRRSGLSSGLRRGR